MALEVDLLAVDRGLVVAPAGCGKTQLIVDALAHYQGARPILVLTHTNAGVAALRGRLERAGVSGRLYRLATIDGWAMRLIATYPRQAGHDPDILNNPNYPRIREAAIGLVCNGHVDDIIKATYAQLIVDEYQDCSGRQHTLVCALSELLSTVILGDDLQAIFTFAKDDAVAGWKEVLAHFPLVAELTTPHRWINAAAKELGQWLLDQRPILRRGGIIDLAMAPEQVTWIELDGKSNGAKMISAGKIDPGGDGRVLILAGGREKDLQQRYARVLPDAVTVEAVDLRDMVGFARRFDINSDQALRAIAEFAGTLLDGINVDDLVQKVGLLAAGTFGRVPSELETAGLALENDRRFVRAAELLVAMNRATGVRVFRPDVLRCLFKSLALTQAINGPTFATAAVTVREQNRLVGRALNKHSVGSPLLLKGLEADGAVILNVGVLNARNLYVAMTRGSRRLVICSPTQQFKPAAGD